MPAARASLARYPAVSANDRALRRHACTGALAQRLSGAAWQGMAIAAHEGRELPPLTSPCKSLPPMATDVGVDVAELCSEKFLSNIEATSLLDVYALTAAVLDE